MSNMPNVNINVGPFPLKAYENQLEEVRAQK
jgi:hypothetical protein